MGCSHWKSPQQPLLVNRRGLSCALPWHPEEPSARREKAPSAPSTTPSLLPTPVVPSSLALCCIDSPPSLVLGSHRSNPGSFQEMARDSGWVLPQLCHRQAAKYFFSLCLSVFISKVGTVTFVLSGFSKEPLDKGNVGIQKLAVGLSVSSPLASQEC